MVQQTINQRVVYLDLLRIMATLAIILIHLSAHGFYVVPIASANWFFDVSVNAILRWAVPVFVMISGALFLKPERRVSYGEIFGKRVPRLLLAYVFWVVAYHIFMFAGTGFSDFTLLRLVRRCIVVPHIHLWFLPMLACIYIMIPILRKIAADEKTLRYALIAWLAYLFISFFEFSKYFELLDDIHRLFAVNEIVGYSGYFLLGYYLSTMDFSKKQRIWIYLAGVAGALAAVFGTCFISLYYGEPQEFFIKELNIHTAAMSAAVFVLAKQLAPRCQNAVTKMGKWMRNDLFGIYLVHQMWIMMFIPIRFSCSEWVMVPLLLIAIFVLSLLSVKLIRLVPYLRKVVE